MWRLGLRFRVSGLGTRAWGYCSHQKAGLYRGLSADLGGRWMVAEGGEGENPLSPLQKIVI